jgi:glucokinase
MTTDEVVHVGVDVGGTTTRAVAFDGALTPVAIEAAPTRPGAASIARRVAELVGALDASLDGARRSASVAVCMPGRVDVGVGTVGDAVNLGITAPVAMGALLEGSLGGSVHLENDVNAAALGTFHHLGLGSQSSLAYVNVGTGIAAGFVLGGRVWRGTTGGAGEIGHIPMRADGPPCPCGQVGCAEAIGSGRAVGTDPERRDDVLAAVAWTVQLCALTLDVELVAIGGGLTEIGQPFLDALDARLEASEAASPFLRSAGLRRRVRLAPAGVPLGAVGAVLAAQAVGAGGADGPDGPDAAR